MLLAIVFFLVQLYDGLDEACWSVLASDFAGKYFILASSFLTNGSLLSSLFLSTEEFFLEAALIGGLQESICVALSYSATAGICQHVAAHKTRAWSPT